VPAAAPDYARYAGLKFELHSNNARAGTDAGHVHRTNIRSVWRLLTV
jgi:hypothetical protein